MVSTDPKTAPQDPWNAVLQIIHCADCGRQVPAHLAERWNGLSMEDARREWRDVYRKRRRPCE